MMWLSFAVFLTVFSYLCSFCTAIDCSGVESDYHRLKRCHTYKEFCSSAFVGPYEFDVAPEYTRHRTITHTGTGTSTTTVTTIKTSVTKTITVVFETETSTIGRRTTTINQCSTRVTCDAATFTERLSLSSACGCLVVSIPTTTRYRHETLPLTTFTKVIETSSTISIYPVATTTVDVATHVTCATVRPAPHATDCGNKGANYASYPIEREDYGNNAFKLTGWDPAIYKTRKPAIQNTTLFIGGFRNIFNKRKMYAYGIDVPARFNMIDTRGYLYASQTGEYNLLVVQVFPKALIWIGDLAYSGWNISNANLKVQAPEGPGDIEIADGRGSFLVHLVAGNYYPLRAIYAAGNFSYLQQYDLCPYGEGCDNFYLIINRPDGKLAEGAYSDNGYEDYGSYSHYGFDVKELARSLIQFSCDGTTAPKFPPFGNET